MSEASTSPVTPAKDYDPAPRIAGELNLPLSGVRAVAKLLAEGGSVPFIARYRKEQAAADFSATSRVLVP